ncbi:MAG TPA: 30S ribosomal protein S9 [Candidatus Paceibacterota bacterium]
MVNKNKEIIQQVQGKYFEGVGRRKTSVARVRVYQDTGEILVNDKPFGDYFKTEEQRKIAKDSLELLNIFKKNRVTAKINGGGIHSQAEALRHGIARALTKMDISLRKTLKMEGFLKRDPRMKERRKFGLKKARKAPQWSKR